jgi:hypothetical protein
MLTSKSKGRSNPNALEKKVNFMGVQKHPFHLVDPSPWPIFSSLAAFTTTFGGVMYMHGYTGGGMALSLGFFMILYSMAVWWRDVIREATFEGHHTLMVQLGLRWGMILFIASEIMFFVAFFWAFFSFKFSPHGGYWRHLAAKGNSCIKSLGGSFLKHGDPSIFGGVRDVGPPRHFSGLSSTSDLFTPYYHFFSGFIYGLPSA